MSRTHNPPTAVNPPLFPVKPGSVLFNLLESTNVHAARTATLISLKDDDAAVSERPKSCSRSRSRSRNRRNNEKSTVTIKEPAKPRSKIPIRSDLEKVQDLNFQRSLRNYGKRPAPVPSSTPKSSRALSPNPRRILESNSSVKKSRTPSPKRSTAVYTALNLKSPRFGNNASSRTLSPGRKRKKSPASKAPRNLPNGKTKKSKTPPPPAPPKTPKPSSSPAEDPVACLAFLPPSIFERRCNLAYSINGRYKPCHGISGCFGWPTDSPLKRDKAEHEKPVVESPNFEKGRLLTTFTYNYSHTLAEMNKTLNCLCKHEEKKCQAISSELLAIGSRLRQRASTGDIRECPKFQAGTPCSCKYCFLNSALKEKENECLKLQQEKESQERKYEEVRKEKERLEQHFFETAEKIVTLESKILQLKTVREDLTLTDAEVFTEKSLQDKLKFQFDDFVFSGMGDSMMNEANDNDTVSNALNNLHLALSYREALLREIRTKLRKSFMILRHKTQPLVIRELSEEHPQTEFVEISPQVADDAFHSHRRFLRFLYTFVENSCREIEENDRKLMYRFESQEQTNAKQLELEIDIEVILPRKQITQTDSRIISDPLSNTDTAATPISGALRWLDGFTSSMSNFKFDKTLVKNCFDPLLDSVQAEVDGQKEGVVDSLSY